MRFSLPSIKCSAAPPSFERTVINSLSTVQTTKQCSAVVESWEPPPNIWFYEQLLHANAVAYLLYPFLGFINIWEIRTLPIFFGHTWRAFSLYLGVAQVPLLEPIVVICADTDFVVRIHLILHQMTDWRILNNIFTLNVSCWSCFFFYSRVIYDL